MEERKKYLPKTNGIYAYRLKESDWTPKSNFFGKQQIIIDYEGFIKMHLDEQGQYYYIIIKFYEDEKGLTAFKFITCTEIFLAADAWGDSNFHGHSGSQKVEVIESQNKSTATKLEFGNFNCHVNDWHDPYAKADRHELYVSIYNAEKNLKGSFNFRFIECLKGKEVATYK